MLIRRFEAADVAVYAGIVLSSGGVGYPTIWTQYKISRQRTPRRRAIVLHSKGHCIVITWHSGLEPQMLDVGDIVGIEIGMSV